MAKKIGRPTVMTPETIDKIEYVFAMGGTDLEACLHADISMATLYAYQDAHPEFSDRKLKLKQKPMLLARTTILNALSTDTNTARWYAERRDPEFNPKSQVDVTTKGESVNTTDLQAIAAQAAILLKNQET